MFDRQTIVDVLRFRAESEPARHAFTFLRDGEILDARLDYAELDRRARAGAAVLQRICEPGHRALLLYPPGLEFIVGFFACLYARIVAVPAYPPDPTRLARSLSRLSAVASDCDASVLLTSRELLALGKDMIAGVPELGGLPQVVTDALAVGAENDWKQAAIPWDSLAFLQYTSGSTASPRGVMVSHANLATNLRDIRDRLGLDAEAMVSWLPTYHDMGLIGATLEPIFVGFPCVQMSPAAFLQRPLRFLRALSRHRPQGFAAPNFSFDLCVRKTTPEERRELDLSSIRYALNGSEPVRAETLERFIDAFGPCGFRREAFYPTYGLAEATLMAAGGAPLREPRMQRVDAAGLAAGRASEPGSGRAISLLSSGHPVGRQRLAIVDPHTRRGRGPGEVGEIWVAGGAIASGYWNRPEESEAVFGGRIADTGEGPFLRTGDLGFMDADGELFVSGRRSDLIIIRGRNLYPQDVELLVEQSHPALRPGCGAAFALEDGSREGLAVVHEVAGDGALDLSELIATIRARIAEELGVAVRAVVLVEPRSLPKTSSGKIQRSACRDAWLADELPVLAEWRDAPARAPITARDTAPIAARDREPSDAPAQAAIENWLRGWLSRELGLSEAEIDRSLPFAEHGLDSAGAASLSGDLSRRLGRALPATLAFDHPTLAKLAEHLHGSDAPALAPRQVAPEEPIAVIGVGCRFPGAAGPEALWRLLDGGGDAIAEVPRERFDLDALYDPTPGTPGRMNTRFGGFVDDVEGFDHAFFAVSAREAERMDPQQRLLLEVGWEALEAAGLGAAALAGSRTGVFIGISGMDHVHGDAPADAIDAWFGTGAAHSIAANRISYLLDLRGPSLAVDTACSSSLVALHLACESLRRGESDLALAGGVNALLSPAPTIAFSQAGMLASDGRCKAFDASADGYVRGEGCGVVVLKRLADARRDGDAILALVRGSAVNQDGRSNGLTAPNGPAQEAVIREALRRAGVRAADISLVEAHGTGTALGDPIEAEALAAVLGEDRPAGRRCWLGSIKTNIGHLEAAAGIAGFIKVVLALAKRRVPAHLHFRELNPRIAAGKELFAIPSRTEPWQAEPRVAGVSSFGFGGTNVHVVVAEAPAPAARPGPERVGRLFVLSAKTEGALRRLAGRFAEATLSGDDLADLCATVAATRSAFDHRLAVPAESIDELQRELSAFASGNPGKATRSLARAGGARPRIAFLFGGQGAQLPGMGADLYRAHPGFRAGLDRCAALFAGKLPRPLLDVMFDRDGAGSQLAETLYAQPALFALGWALSEVWRGFGVVPDALLGHSIGEYTAACVAGSLRLEDAAALVAERARLMQELPAGGAMAAVFAGEARVRAAIGSEDAVSIAAVNAAERTVISGATATVLAVASRLAAEGVESRRLEVSHAFHSARMDAVLDRFEAAARRVAAEAPRIPLVSNRTGAVHAAAPDAAYWRAHLRETVRFADGLATLRALGCDVLIELSPQPVLVELARLDDPSSRERLLLPSLRRGRPDWRCLLEALADLYLRGVGVDWTGFDREVPRRIFPGLPTYPFERAAGGARRRADAHAPGSDPRGAASTDAGGRASGSELIAVMREQLDAMERLVREQIEIASLAEDFAAHAPRAR